MLSSLIRPRSGLVTDLLRPWFPYLLRPCFEPASSLVRTCLGLVWPAWDWFRTCFGLGFRTTSAQVPALLPSLVRPCFGPVSRNSARKKPLSADQVSDSRAFTPPSKLLKENGSMERIISDDYADTLAMDYMCYVILSFLTFRRVSGVERKKQRLKQELALLRNRN